MLSGEHNGNCMARSNAQRLQQNARGAEELGILLQRGDGLNKDGMHIDDSNIESMHGDDG